MEEAAGAAALAQRLDLSERGTAALLDACVALGLLAKAGDAYRNTPAGDRYLTRGSPESLRVTLELQAATYPMWMRLSEAVTNGRPVATPTRLTGSWHPQAVAPQGRRLGGADGDGALAMTTLPQADPSSAYCVSQHRIDARLFVDRDRSG